jgi:uncharacterized iron-regulated membrane protein
VEGLLKLKTGRGLRVLWSDAHKLAGLWGLWFVLLMATTGTWYLVELFEVDLGYPDITPTARTAADTGELPLDALVARAQAEWPALKISALYLPADWNAGTLLVQGSTGAVLVRDRANEMYIDTVSGQTLARKSAESVGWPARWVDTADPLHFGNFGGLPVKLVWAAFGLALSGMCLSGTWLHAQRVRREAGGHARSRWPGERLSFWAAVGVLAASAVGGWQEIKSYGPLVSAEQRWPEVPVPVLIFLVAWCVLSFWIMRYWCRLLASSERSTTAGRGTIPLAGGPAGDGVFKKSGT